MDMNLASDIFKLVDGTSFDNQWICEALDRLESLGYVACEEDVYLISFCIQKVDSFIRNVCNILKIDECLKSVAIDRVCGEVLLCLKSSDRFKECFNIEEAVKSIQTGDIDVVFDKLISEEDRINQLISHLMGSGSSEFASCRRIRW